MYPPYLTKGRNWTPFRLVKSLSTIVFIFLAGLVPVDHLKGLEQAAISKRAERLKEYKEYIEDLPEKDAKRILKELAILEKIRAQK